MALASNGGPRERYQYEEIHDLDNRIVALTTQLDGLSRELKEYYVRQSDLSNMRSEFFKWAAGLMAGAITAAVGIAVFIQRLLA